MQTQRRRSGCTTRANDGGSSNPSELLSPNHRESVERAIDDCHQSILAFRKSLTSLARELSYGNPWARGRILLELTKLGIPIDDAVIDKSQLAKVFLHFVAGSPKTLRWTNRMYSPIMSLLLAAGIDDRNVYGSRATMKQATAIRRLCGVSVADGMRMTYKEAAKMIIRAQKR